MFRSNVERRKSNEALRVLMTAAALLLVPFLTHAQCAMCRAALETEGNATKAEAVNDGIVYLMIIPYLLVAGIAYAIWRLRKKTT